MAQQLRHPLETHCLCLALRSCFISSLTRASSAATSAALRHRHWYKRIRPVYVKEQEVTSQEQESRLSQTQAVISFDLPVFSSSLAHSRSSRRRRRLCCHKQTLQTEQVMLAKSLLCLAAVTAAAVSVVHAKKTALVAVANGTDEVEAIVVTDVLRRAGVQVTIGGFNCVHILGDSDILFKADKELVDDEPVDYDAVIIPGGSGVSETFGKSAVAGKYLKKAEEGGKIIAAVCSGGDVLVKHGIGKGKKVSAAAESHKELKDAGYEVCEKKVVVDGTLITAQAQGQAFDFALAIVDKLLGEEAACDTAKALRLERRYV